MILSNVLIERAGLLQSIINFKITVVFLVNHVTCCRFIQQQFVARSRRGSGSLTDSADLTIERLCATDTGVLCANIKLLSEVVCNAIFNHADSVELAMEAVHFLCLS